MNGRNEGKLRNFSILPNSGSALRHGSLRFSLLTTPPQPKGTLIEKTSALSAPVDLNVLVRVNSVESSAFCSVAASKSACIANDELCLLVSQTVEKKGYNNQDRYTAL